MKFEPELRIAAFHVIVESVLSTPFWTTSGDPTVELPIGFSPDRLGSSEMLLSTVARKMKTEPNLHVKSFIYSSLKSLARSKPEEYKFIARVVRSVMRHMNPSEPGIYRGLIV